jgi:hypothetical protein
MEMQKRVTFVLGVSWEVQIAKGIGASCKLTELVSTTEKGRA